MRLVSALVLLSAPTAALSAQQPTQAAKPAAAPARPATLIKNATVLTVTKGTLANVAWSDEIVKRSDFVLAMQGQRDLPQREMSLLKGRNTPLVTFPIHFKHSPALDMSEISGVGADFIELVC